MRIAVVILIVVALVVGAWLWIDRGARPSDGVDVTQTPEDDVGEMIGVEPGLAGREGAEPDAEVGDSEAGGPTEPVPAEPITNTARDPVPYVIEGEVRDRATGELVSVPLELHVQLWNGRGVDVRKVPVETFASGLFRLETDTGAAPYIGEMVSRSRDWQVFWWFDPITGERTSDTSEGAVNRIVVEVLRAFHLRGRVTDEEGAPVGDVRIQLPVLKRTGSTAFSVDSEYSVTLKDGTFDVGPFPQDRTMGLEKGQVDLLESMGRLLFSREGFPTISVDPWTIDEAERDALEVVLPAGLVLAGVVVTEGGQPLANVPVAAEYDNWNQRRGVRTDASGAFRIDTLASGPMTLRTRAFAFDRKGAIEMDLQESNEDVRLVASSIPLPDDLETHTVLGLGISDVTDELREAYDLPAYVHVVILDPGSDPESLGIGLIERGQGLWRVHDDDVTSVAHAVELLLRDHELPPKSCRLVYTFWNERMSGTNTQHVELTDEQRARLLDLQERLR